MRRNLTRVIALVATVTALFTVAPATIPSAPPAATAYSLIGDCTPGSNWGTLRQDLASQVVQLVNQHRASLGLVQLQVTTPLTNSAVWKSRHMAYYQYMAHNDPAPPVARSVGDRLLVCGYPANSAGWGENIAYGYPSAASVMQGWLNSPGHRQNIENPSYRGIGVGAASSGGGTLYWTQQFGTSLSGGGTPPPPPPPSSAATPAASAAEPCVLERRGRRRGREGRLPGGSGLLELIRQRRVEPGAGTSAASASAATSATARPGARTRSVRERRGRRLRRQGRLPGRPRLLESERRQRVQLQLPPLGTRRARWGARVGVPPRFRPPAT